MRYGCLAICLIYYCSLAPFNPIPLCSVYTPNSILLHKEQHKVLYLGEKKRYSTCTGATWFHEKYLAVLNLHGRKIIVYEFDEPTKTFNPIQEINNHNGILAPHPENLTVSPDGTILAVCTDLPEAGVHLYSIHPVSHHISTKPILVLRTKELTHNVKFSPDGTYLAITGWHPAKKVCIYALEKQTKTIRTFLTYQGTYESDAFKGKAITFSHNGKYALVAYAHPVRATTIHPETILVCYRFNPDGTLGEIVSSQRKSGTTEDMVLINNETTLIVSDQSNDSLALYPFDSETGILETQYASIQNPEAQLSFPHGLALSPDKRYLIVTNYGDDKFNLYQIQP